MFGFKLLGKTHVPHCKNTAEMTPVRMTPPTEVLIPMCQHIGSPATPIVKVGDRVITSKYAGTEVKADGVEYNIVRQSDILAVVE